MILNCPSCHSRFLIPDAALGVDGRTVRCGRCRHQWFQTLDDDAAPFADFKPVSAADIIRANPAPAQDVPPSVSGGFGAELIAEQDANRATASTDSSASDDQTHGSDEGVIDHLEERRQRAAARAAENEEIPYFEGPLDPATPYDERLLPALRARLPASLWLKASALGMSTLAVLLLLIAYAPRIAAYAPWSLPILHALGAAPADGLMLADVAFEARPEGDNYKRFIIGCAVRNTTNAPRALPNLRLQLYNRAGERIVEERNLLAPIPTIAAGDDVPCDIPSPPMRPGTAQTIVLDLGNPIDLWKRAPLY